MQTIIRWSLGSDIVYDDVIECWTQQRNIVTKCKVVLQSSGTYCLDGVEINGFKNSEAWNRETYKREEIFSPKTITA